MDVISLQFAGLAVLSILLFYLLNTKYRIAYLLILSVLFVFSYSQILTLYILLYASVNFVCGIIIQNSKQKKFFFKLGVIINLTQLIILKYASFAIDPIVSIIGFNYEVSKLSSIIVPLGISYFTLQGIGYLINIKMGWEKPESKFLNFLLYIFFYPKFLSGPIERSNHFLPQLRVADSFDAGTVSEGLKIALLGFFKKVVIANQLGIMVNETYSGMGTINGLNLWMVVLIQPLYLYFDFSGYTDIAIGIAKTYGINLLPNFNRPFLSENMTTFWKRFHMSLSSWFNDYVFRQLSFKYRKWGKYASVFSVFVTFTLFGIWHGAGWSFMVLGFLQAVAINYEFFTKRQRIKIGSMIPSFWRVLFSRLFTYFFYGVSLIFFFAKDLDSAFLFITKMVNFIPGPGVVTLPHLTSFALSVAILFLIIDYLKEDYDEISNLITNFFNNSKIIRILLYYVMVMLIITFMGTELTFIYQVF